MSAPSPTPEEIFAQYVGALGPDEAVDVGALGEAHPEHAAELRRLAEEWARFSPVFDALAAESSFGERLRRRFGSAADPEVSLDAKPSTDPPTGSSGVLRRLEAHAPKESRYSLVGELARGGMGAVLKVWDSDLRRSLAMKVVLGRASVGDSGESVDERSLGRFLEEAQVTAQLDHPGIVPVHELGLDESGKVYFTMRLVRGDDLARVFEKVKKGEEGWTRTRAAGVVLRVCEAMAYAHSKHVIHRDLKPSNVMVGRFGEVYVMDWGLARVLGREDKTDIRLREPADLAMSGVETDLRRDADGDSPLVTMDGDVVGTPSYMSPEQARGDLPAMGPASDVYSIGAILYHLLVGHMPYVPKGARINNVGVWALVQQGPPKSLAEVAPSAPPELVAICDKAMARGPEERYADTNEMAEDLRAYLEGRVVRAHKTGRWIELTKWVGRNRALAGTVAAALVLGLVGTTVALLFQARSNRNLRLEIAEHELTKGALEEQELEAARLAQILVEREQRADELEEILGEQEQLRLALENDISQRAREAQSMQLEIQKARGGEGQAFVGFDPVKGAHAMDSRDGSSPFARSWMELSEKNAALAGALDDADRRLVDTAWSMLLRRGGTPEEHAAAEATLSSMLAPRPGVEIARNQGLEASAEIALAAAQVRTGRARAALQALRGFDDVELGPRLARRCALFKTLALLEVGDAEGASRALQALEPKPTSGPDAALENEVEERVLEAAR